jgi:hypothetical protein
MGLQYVLRQPNHALDVAKRAEQDRAVTLISRPPALACLQSSELRDAAEGPACTPRARNSTTCIPKHAESTPRIANLIPSSNCAPPGLLV